MKTKKKQQAGKTIWWKQRRVFISTTVPKETSSEWNMIYKRFLYAICRHSFASVFVKALMLSHKAKEWKEPRSVLSESILKHMTQKRWKTKINCWKTQKCVHRRKIAFHLWFSGIFCANILVLYSTVKSFFPELADLKIKQGNFMLPMTILAMLAIQNEKPNYRRTAN